MRSITTGRGRVAVAAAGLLLLGASVRAQFGQTRRGNGENPPDPVIQAPADPSAELAAVLAKINAGTEITRAELLIYLRAIEAHQENREVIQASATATASEDLPARAWALISTKLHNYFYGTDRTLSFFGIDLFLNGSENQGWEQINYLSEKPPKFMKNPDDETVDAAHAFAGVAAVVMRDGEVAGTLMGNVNTGWGDSVQVWGGRISGATNMVLGVFSDERAARGRQQWDQAPNFKPPDQVRGNELGNEARDYIQDHRSAALSTAFEHAFEEVDG